MVLRCATEGKGRSRILAAVNDSGLARKVEVADTLLRSWPKRP
jgi:hypothetical protein